MRTFLICPDVQEIYCEELGPKSFYMRALELLKCNYLEQFILPNKQVLLLDEDGKLKGKNYLGYFMLPKYTDTIFAGRGLLASLSVGRSDWCASHFTLEEVNGFTVWADPSERIAKPATTIVWCG